MDSSISQPVFLEGQPWGKLQLCHYRSHGPSTTFASFLSTRTLESWSYSIQINLRGKWGQRREGLPGGKGSWMDTWRVTRAWPFRELEPAAKGLRHRRAGGGWVPVTGGFYTRKGMVGLPLRKIILGAWRRVQEGRGGRQQSCWARPAPTPPSEPVKTSFITSEPFQSEKEKPLIQNLGTMEYYSAV